MDIIYEDNHIIVVNKRAGEIVQGDKTGDEPMSEALKTFIKERDSKPGNVFIGVVHRLDRPVGGLVVFAKTSKALSRLNEMFRRGDVHKTYWALSRNCPEQPEGLLENHLLTDGRLNKTRVVVPSAPGAKLARLRYEVLGHSDRYTLLQVQLLTGRKHQIRVQLSAMGCPIKGDLKYGDRRSNPDGSISLFAREIDFVHPVSHKRIQLFAPLPEGDAVWRAFDALAAQSQYQSTENE